MGAWVLLLFLSEGCGTLRFGRLESYQALPLPQEEFAVAEQYAVVLVPQPYVLRASERGNAWKLLIRRSDATVEHVVAVQYHLLDLRATCTATAGLLLAVLPGNPERYRDADGVLVAHDGDRCFGAGGTMLPCASSAAWKYAMPLQVIPVVSRSQDPNDERLRAWYEHRLRFAMVRAANTALGEEEYERIASEESIWRDVRDAGVVAGIGGTTAGFVGQNVIQGLIVAGVTFLVQMPFALLRKSTGPEYGDAPMPASAVAELSDALRVCAIAPRDASPHASR
ncbi:hypothetical protein HYV74_02455 [Candidatus Uhrbacteria bacterium]|nr:hypothetical protein [Candidatus Uhrbacteria bacterium]